MKYNVTFEQIVAELVNIFGDENRMKDYKGKCGGQYLGVLGWAGPMSPANRVAFVDAFGENTVTSAESLAQKQITMKEAEYATTNHAVYVCQANENESKAGFVPQEGDFVWALSTGLKNEGGGIPKVVRDILEYHEYENHTSLCFVDRVIHVDSDKLLQGSLPDDLVAEAVKNQGCEAFPGGHRNDDKDYKDIFDEYRTWYIETAAVVDESGRWYLINGEGYNYARYLLLPLRWESMFSDLKTETEAKLNAEAEAARIEKERKEAEELAEYERRCEKWAHLMTDIEPLKKAADEAYKQYGWKSKEYKAADRALGSARRNNITAMVHAAFPGLEISIRRNKGWGSAWNLSYKDGPTEEEFGEATDLNLFAMGHYTFDGMTDCAGYEEEKHTGFAAKYMGNDVCGDIDVERYMSKETEAMLSEKVKKAVPDAVDALRVYSQDDLQAIADEIGCDVSWLERTNDYYHSRCSIHDLIYAAWRHMNLFVPKQVRKAEPKQDAKPKAENIQVIDYSEKAIVVTGDTKPIKDDLKRLGGKPNPRLKCGFGWVFGKRNKKNLAELDKFLGGALVFQLPELMKGAVQ